MQSNCCGAGMTEVYKDVGRCMDCKEMAGEAEFEDILRLIKYGNEPVRTSNAK